jgi:prevent-host-death family protein
MEHEPIERSAREIRAHLADVIGDAIAGKVTFITSNGRRVAAVVPLALASAGYSHPGQGGPPLSEAPRLIAEARTAIDRIGKVAEGE